MYTYMYMYYSRNAYRTLGYRRTVPRVANIYGRSPGVSCPEFGPGALRISLRRSTAPRVAVLDVSNGS